MRDEFSNALGDYTLGERSFDADVMLHPYQFFGAPEDVVHDRHLTLQEKRAILASWASDACAVEAAPALRKSPSGRLVRFDEIMDALRDLDRQLSPALRRDRQHAASGRVSLGNRAAAHPNERSATQ